MNARDRLDELHATGQTEMARDLARGILTNQSVQQVTLSDDHETATIITELFIGEHQVRSLDGFEINSRGKYTLDSDSSLEFTVNSYPGDASVESLWDDGYITSAKQLGEELVPLQSVTSVSVSEDASDVIVETDDFIGTHDLTIVPDSTTISVSSEGVYTPRNSPGPALEIERPDIKEEARKRVREHLAERVAQTPRSTRGDMSRRKSAITKILSLF